MDGQRFDELTRALANRASRRGVLKGLAAGAVGAVAALGRRRANAQDGCGEVNDACSSDSDCCGAVAPLGIPGGGSVFCSKPRGRRRGKCACADGFSFCPGSGACCPPGTSCVNGACSAPCPPARQCPGSPFPSGCCPEGCACIDVGVCSCPV